MSASATDLMRQAWKTAAEYMDHAKEEIDRTFGEGYAAKHPELVAAFMETAARDFQTGMMAKRIETSGHVFRETITEAITEALSNRE